MRYPLVQRGLIALVQVLVMGVWFRFRGCSRPGQAVAHERRVGRLADYAGAGRVRGRGHRLGRAWLGRPDAPAFARRGVRAGAAGCTLVMALFADGPFAAVPLRFATGAFLAGVYPVGIKLMASWSRPAGRALAVGCSSEP